MIRRIQSFIRMWHLVSKSGLPQNDDLFLLSLFFHFIGRICCNKFGWLLALIGLLLGGRMILTLNLHEPEVRTLSVIGVVLVRLRLVSVWVVQSWVHAMIIETIISISWGRGLPFWGNCCRKLEPLVDHFYFILLWAGLLFGSLFASSVVSSHS